MTLANGHANGHNGHANGHSEIRPLRVIIIGAGIGGLTAAIYLRQQGHTVTLLEQSRFANEVGAAMHLAPNCNGLLRRIGLRTEDIGANEMLYMTEYDDQNKLKRSASLQESNKQWQHPWHLVHRVHLHEELKRRAVDPAGTGPPAVLKKTSRVKTIDPATAVAVLENGECVQGDVIIGADGVHSVSRRYIPGGEDMKIKPSGKSAFRFLVSRDKVLANAATAQFAQKSGELIMWYGKDRRVVMYPCSSNQQLNFVCIHPREASEASTKNKTDWHAGVNRETLLDVYKGFDDAILQLIGMADPETLNVWELFDMDILPGWTNDRLALLGDACHPFLPHQGQGAGVAIEDAASLAVVLRSGTPLDEVPERLKLYEKFRYERANRIQEYSRQAGRDLGEQKLDMMEYTNYNFGHDEWDHSVQAFRKWDWARKPNLYWRMPVSFGPFPGPRQDVNGVPRSGTQSTFTTASVKFKTSRTLLQNLFPSVQFRFQSPGTVAYASFSQTTLNKMQWLGGGGYRHIGLYIHGVQFVKKNGDVVNGTFLPILFESLTDPIVSGREELGMPKLYCTIDVYRRDKSYRIQTGWEGVPFGTVALEGLTEVDAAAEKGTIGGEDDDGLFAYKYMPRVGRSERGNADVEHATFVPHAEEAKVVATRVEHIYKAASASISFDGLDWDALPTLHHVVGRLAELPIYEIVGGKVVQGLGVPDVSSAAKIE